MNGARLAFCYLYLFSVSWFIVVKHFFFFLSWHLARNLFLCDLRASVVKRSWFLFLPKRPFLCGLCVLCGEFFAFAFAFAFSYL